MIYARRVDTNHGEIMVALRKIGASVQSLHRVGSGCPDLLIGYRGRCYVFEVKDGVRAPSEKQLTKDEKTWHEQWRGQVAIVESAVQAVQMLLNLSRLAA